MKIAMIGPGIMEIPPKNWGAVEILMWDLAEATRQLGHEVKIFNDSNLYNVAQAVNSEEFDFIHLQYDNHAGFLSKNLNQPFCVTSHYGWILQPKMWDMGYQQIFKDMADCKGIIALSPEIANFYREYYDNEFITYLRNGTTVEKFKFKPQGNGRILYLGKIESRKRQAQIAQTFPDLPIDFIGPIVDSNFQPCGQQRYLGTWSKDQVYENLTDYSALMLLSGGEAAPLVVPEALAAGLSVVVSPQSQSNLSESNNPGYIIVNDNEAAIKSALRLSLQTNEPMRAKIRESALNYFDWSVIAHDYIQIIHKFKEFTSK